MIAHSHTPYLISFFLIFYCDSQLPNFFKQRKFLSQFLGIIPGDGQIYFLLSKLPSQFHPNFLNYNLIVKSSGSSLLFRRLVRRNCSSALTNERCSPWWSMVNSVDSGDHQKHRAATSGFASNSILFFLTKRLFMLFAAIKSYSFYLTFWLWDVLRHLRILGSCFYYRQGERMKKIECARENILIRSS